MTGQLGCATAHQIAAGLRRLEIATRWEERRRVLERNSHELHCEPQRLPQGHITYI
jgi:hypothetical protein